MSNSGKTPFHLTYPKIKLPPASDYAGSQLATTGEYYSLPSCDMKFGGAWRLVWDLASPSFSHLVPRNILFSVGLRDIQKALQPIFKAIEGIFKRGDESIKLKAQERPAGFWFIKKLSGAQEGIITTMAIRVTNDGKKYIDHLEDMYHMLMKAWDGNNNKNLRAPDVWGMLLDRNGGVVFRLVISDPGASSKERVGHIACSKYLPVFSHLMPSHGMPSAFHYILRAVNPDCKDWEEKEWKKVHGIEQEKEVLKKGASILADGMHNYYESGHTIYTLVLSYISMQYWLSG
ncbi:hypothetical protein Vretifemale_20625 [Volvox reticuliferus]|uniref:Uncharacterized protein n=1 Tax=Volvox reticuliferus TaxID=1737510 RepID=A0A8J4D043_9CHLO|nr:hypothetical protein Vretifemale_20625 [Volvox reticuliferus]